MIQNFDDAHEKVLEVAPFEEINKAEMLEYASNLPRQEARPIFRAFRHSGMLEVVAGKFLKTMVLRSRGGSLEKLGKDMSFAMRQYIVAQNFPLEIPELLPFTVNRKEEKGSLYPDRIGLDTLDMVNSIETRIT